MIFFMSDQLEYGNETPMDTQSFYAFAAAVNMLNSTISMPTPNQPKPAVGTVEHERLKKETHREVERRRRETMNVSIKNLAELLPGREKNKGKILEQTIQYIHDLKQQQQSIIEKWNLEKTFFDQAYLSLIRIQEYNSQIEDLKLENNRLRSLINEDNHKRLRS